MSQKNFVAKHGLTVGNTTIDATTDVANLINVYANGNVTLGNIANVHILGGTANQVIQTDGTGNLIWINSTLDGVMTNTIDPFTGDGNTSNFTLSVTPVSTAFTTVVIDGATQLKSAYSLQGNVLTLSAAPANGVSMEVTTVNGANALAPTLNSIINGNSSVTVALDGDITATTTGNVILGNSVTANYFTGRLYGTANTAAVANTVAGANVTGTVANATYALSSNTANSATVAASANSVAGANVTGAVANATHANTASIAYAVNGSDVVGRVANATYANTAGTVATIAGANVTGTVANATFAETANAVTANAQANITSLGILSTLTTTGNVTIGGNLTVNGSATVSNAVYANSANFATYSTTANVANLAYSISAANITGNIAYAIDSNTANIANVANTAYSVSGANVSGAVANATHANTATTANSVAAANVTGLGNIATANLDGNSSNILYGNGVFASAPVTYGDTNVATYLTTYTGVLSGNASNISNVAGANVTGWVANANTANTAYSVEWSNIANIGTIANANYAANADYAANANVANTANSVALANVSGIGNIANINLDGNALNVLAGNGAWINITANDDANYANYAGEANTANLANTANTANLALSVEWSNIANIGEIANANFSTYSGTANTANLVEWSNIANIGEIANANFATYSGTANIANLAHGVEWANIANIGTIANANHSEYANTANTAATVTTNAQPNITSLGNLTALAVTGNISAGNVTVTSGGSIGINPQSEIHVAKNGNDTTGVGSISNPYRTISHALTLVGNGTKIIVHAGNYTEDVTVANVAGIAISAYQPGASNPSTYTISGNVTTSGNTSGLLLHSIGVIGNLTHNSSGSMFVKDIQLGSSANTTTFTKSGSGYLEVVGGDWQGGTTSVNITGAGAAVFDNVKLSNVTVNNANASAMIRNSTTVINTTLTNGTLTAVSSTMYGNSNTAAAITTTAGTLNMKGLLVLRANATAGLLNVGSSTVYLYDDMYFDKTNSTLSGTSIANTIYAGPTDFQAIRADSIALTGNLSANAIVTVDGITANGNVTAQYFKGDGSLLTGIAPTVQVYEFANVASNVGSYLSAKWLSDFVAGTKRTDTVTVSTTPTLLQAFITDTDYPNLTVLPVGTIAVTVNTAKTSGNRTYVLYAEIYKRSSGGTETLIATTTYSDPIIVNTDITTVLSAYLSAPIQLLSTDRIITKIYAYTDSSTASIAIDYDDATGTGIQLPALPASASQFVPYTGATANIDIGTYTLTTANLNVTGTVKVNSKQAVNGPMFSAYANSATQTITSGSQQKVLFQVEEYDTNSNFANSRFTPTVEGYYQLNSSVRIEGSSGTGEMMIVIWKNGSEYKRGTNQSGTQIAADFWTMTISTMVYANGTTDYFEVYVQQGSGADRNLTTVNSVNITYFNGCMLRGA